MTTPPGPGGPDDAEQPGGNRDDASQQQPGQGWGELPPPAQYGQQPPQPPQYGQPPGQYGQYGQHGPPQGFVVSQPGIVPLRPLSLGDILDGAIKAIRANPGVMFGLTAVVVALIAVIEAVATWGLYEDLERLAGIATPTAADVEFLMDTMVASIGPLLLTSLVSFVVTTVLNGVLIHSVSQSAIGRKMDLGELWSLVRGQLLRLAGLTIVVVLIVIATALVAIAPIMVFALIGEPMLLLVGGLLSLVLVFLLPLAAVTMTLLATPALVLERAGIGAALRRAWRLTRPRFWRVFGIYLLTAVLASIATFAVAAPVGWIASALGTIGASVVAQVIGTTIAAALTTPFVAGVVALLYIDARIRDEGLDAELASAAAGDPA